MKHFWINELKARDTCASCLAQTDAGSCAIGYKHGFNCRKPASKAELNLLVPHPRAQVTKRLQANFFAEVKECKS